MKLLAVLLLFGFINSKARACQFDAPGMSHQQWMQWVEDRNKKNAELATSEVPKAKAGKNPSSRQYRETRRSTNGDNAVIRIRDR